MNVLKPILIVVIVVVLVSLTAFMMKAKQVSAPDTSSPGREKNGGKCVAVPPQKVPGGFFIVYMGRRVPVTHYPFLIGRGPGNDLMLTDVLVARRHAELFLKGGQVCIRDLGALNGMKVNDVSLRKAPITGGERILLGKTLLQIEREQPDDGAPDDIQR